MIAFQTCRLIMHMQNLPLEVLSSSSSDSTDVTDTSRSDDFPCLARELPCIHRPAIATRDFHFCQSFSLIFGGVFPAIITADFRL